VTLTAGEAPVPALNQIGVTLGGPTPIVTLGYTDRLPGGDLTLTFTGFRDLLGNETPISTLVIPFVPDRTPPSVTGAEVLTETTVRVTFSETVPAATALDPERYAVSDGVGTPRGVVYASGQIGTAVVLTFETPFEAQRLFTLTVAGLADRSGNLSPAQELLLFFGEPDVPVPGDVVINELMFDPLAGSDGEYVEVLNTTSKTFDLRRFRLTDDGDGDADPISETPLILPPNGLVVLASVPDTVRSVFGEVAGLFEPDDVPGLNNTEDTVVLQAEVEGGVLTIDQVTYSDDWHRPELRETDGIALERIAPDGRSNDAANWSSSLDARGGTPGASNSVFVDPEAPPPGDAGLVIDSPFAPDEGQSSRIAYTLEADAAVVRVRLYDGAGRRVRTLESGDLTGRTGFLDWDGRDDAGRQLRVGIYVVLLEALDAQGGTAEAYKEVVVLARRF
ncbi:MAG: lamin tail domain-containing protein, partial [Bacteroidota bacterium]